MRATTAVCQCGESSARVHGRYIRRLRDVAAGGLGVVIEVGVRRFRCENARCPAVTGLGKLRLGENLRPAEFIDSDRTHGALRTLSVPVPPRADRAPRRWPARSPMAWFWASEPT
ncbi:transposase family protein [Streptomyces sp900116325]|uniref:transposase family protein n=1 Tax=Streptomyces sp. 900116325 TaxID=3154295 RepID=UPI0033B2C07B